MTSDDTEIKILKALCALLGGLALLAVAERVIRIFTQL